MTALLPGYEWAVGQIIHIQSLHFPLFLNAVINQRGDVLGNPAEDLLHHLAWRL